MLVLLVVNFIGIRSGARTQNVLSMLKIVMIAGLLLHMFNLLLLGIVLFSTTVVLGLCGKLTISTLGRG